MLSEKEKQEMLEDAFNESLREQYAEAHKKRLAQPQSRELDDYIQFLMSIQKVFPFPHEKQKTETTFNKL